MFHFPEFPVTQLFFHCALPWHSPGRVSPFGHLRIEALPQLPQLFAVVHVLPRPLAPRHPPYALRSLTCCAQNQPSRNRLLFLTPAAVLLYPIQFLMCQPCYFLLPATQLARRRPGHLLPSFCSSRACQYPGSLPSSAQRFLPTSATRLWACVDSNHGPLRYQHSALTG